MGRRGDGKTKNLAETDGDLSKWITASNKDGPDRRWYTANDQRGRGWQTVSSEEKTSLKAAVCADKRWFIKEDMLWHLMTVKALPFFVVVFLFSKGFYAPKIQQRKENADDKNTFCTCIQHKTAKSSYVMYYIKTKPVPLSGWTICEYNLTARKYAYSIFLAFYLRPGWEAESLLAACQMFPAKKTVEHTNTCKATNCLFYLFIYFLHFWFVD